MPMLSKLQKAKQVGALIASAGLIPRRLRPCACAYIFYWRPGRSSHFPTCRTVERIGKSQLEADDARCEEVRLADNTDEVDEQRRATDGGVDGGKRRDQEECELAKHCPCPEPGSGVTGASAHT